MNKIRITYNQIELLNIIESFRYLPLKVLQKVALNKGLYSHRQSLERAIISLEGKGLLRSFYYGNNWKVVFITSKCTEVLSDVYGKSKEEFSVPNQGRKVQFAMLEHSVKICEIYDRFLTLVNQNPDIELVRWIGDQRMRTEYEFRSDRTGKTIRRILSPDSYFKLSENGEEKDFFLEYDTGTMDFEQLSLKFMRYFEYFVYGDWQEKYDSFPQILFLTERSKKRLDNLQIKPEYSLQEALKARGLFTQSKNLIWNSIGRCENLQSVGSYEIERFLDIEIKFAELSNM